MKYKKIIVFGLTASGKTTLARKISQILKIKIYHTDNFAYIKKWTKKATEEEFMKKLKEAVKKEKWILEGVHSEWMSKAIKKADLVIFINPNKITLAKRVLKRSKKKGKDNSRARLKLIYWVYRWDLDGIENTRTSLKNLLNCKMMNKQENF